MGSPRRTVGEPHDRLTRLCAAMTDTLDAHPEANGKQLLFAPLGGDG